MRRFGTTMVENADFYQKDATYVVVFALKNFANFPIDEDNATERVSMQWIVFPPLLSV